MELENVQKRAKTSSIGEKRAEGRLDIGEALMGEVLVWPVAASYRIAPGGVMAPEPGCKPHMGVRSFPPPSPLKYPELYLSFAKLAYGGKTKKRILDWVSEYGLLTRKDVGKGGDVLLNGRVVNQAPMTIDDFTAHVAKFDGLVRLYAEIGSANAQAITSRIGRRASVIDERPAADCATGSTQGRMFTSLDYEASYATHPLLSVADQVLCDVIAEELDGVRIRPVSGFAYRGRRPAKNWRISDQRVPIPTCRLTRLPARISSLPFTSSCF